VALRFVFFLASAPMSSYAPNLRRALFEIVVTQQAVEKKAFSTACALTLVSPEAGEKIRKEASFTQGVESLLIAILGFPGVFQHPARRAACFSAAHLRSAGCARSGVHRRRPSRLGLPAHWVYE